VLNLFAIGDLHLGFTVEKPMDIFGDNWASHEKTIKENWESQIGPEDLVLIPGDISWGTRFEEAYEDLKWVDALPGTKIISKGNHDYWWQSLKKMQGRFRTIFFLHNNFYHYDDLAICGTRGWICPKDDDFEEHDLKIYEREGIRLRISLEEAKKAGFKKFLVMLHYPPTNDELAESIFTAIIKEYGVKTVIYGHLHAEGSRAYTMKGTFDGVTYHLVSADYIGFNPVKLL